MGERGLLQLVRRFNNVTLAELEGAGYLPFTFQRSRIGTVSPAVVDQLRTYGGVFTVHPDRVQLSDKLTTYEQRSEAIRTFLEEMRDRKVFSTLSGWRNECYEIRPRFSQESIFKVERSGTPLFGFRQYGVHINGFVQTSEKDKSIWIQRRSKTKPTYPGKLDSFVGGGFSEGFGVLETAIKELEEEAGFVLPSNLELRPCGSVSFLHRSERGIHPQTEFIFDLQLPAGFQPVNKDGEVEEFMLVSSDKLLNLIQTQEYKTTSIPVALDWLVRHSFLSVDSEPDLPDVLEEIHSPLHLFYS